MWKCFNEFFVKLDEKPKTWEDRLILFVGYLIDKNRKSTTIKSYVSAIKAVLMGDGVELCENKYLISSLTRACRLKNDTVRKRFPIQKGLLAILLVNVEKLYPNQPYLMILYQCIFSTAYFGLFRIGELAESPHAIKARDVYIAQNKQKMRFVLHTSKTHWHDVKPQVIKITSETIKSKGKIAARVNCPFSYLRQYIAHRKSCAYDTEQFFIFRDRTPVQIAQVRCVLKRCIDLTGLDSNLYNTQSFRAGRSVDLMEMKVGLDVVKKLGRWSSNSVYRYLKI